MYYAEELHYSYLRADPRTAIEEVIDHDEMLNLMMLREQQYNELGFTNFEDLE